MISPSLGGEAILKYSNHQLTTTFVDGIHKYHTKP